MNIRVLKCDKQYTYLCYNQGCDRLNDHVEFIYENNVGRPHIKLNSVMVELKFKLLTTSTTIYLCRGCIDKFYLDCKKTFE